MMFHIAICDDEVILCRQIEKYLEEYIARGLVKTEIFYSADKLYDALNKGEYYDLIFLDIEFQLSNGVEIGQRIRMELECEKVQIVYISAKQSYAMELFPIRPMNFLVKPISRIDVINNVDKAIELSEIYGSFFEFKFRTENYRVPYESVLYFESDNRKIYIHTERDTKQMYGKLSEIETVVPPTFIRIHQSYLINRMYVIYWSSEELVLTNDCRLPVSQTYRKSMCKALMQNKR